jgi:hypothetical protein
MSVVVRQQGQGKLRNCIFPGVYFKVEYSLWQTGVVTSANRFVVTQLGTIEYIRVLDGTRMPNGKYNLELAADQRAEIVAVRKRCDNWELLSVRCAHTARAEQPHDSKRPTTGFTVRAGNRRHIGRDVGPAQAPQRLDTD